MAEQRGTLTAAWSTFRGVKSLNTSPWQHPIFYILATCLTDTKWATSRSLGRDFILQKWLLLGISLRALGPGSWMRCSGPPCNPICNNVTSCFVLSPGRHRQMEVIEELDRRGFLCRHFLGISYKDIITEHNRLSFSLLRGLSRSD